MWISKEELTELIDKGVETLEQAGCKTAHLLFQTGSGQSFYPTPAECIVDISYSEVYGFPVPRAEGHTGRLRYYSSPYGNFYVMSGRSHFYEGYEGWEVSLPIRILRKLDVRDFIFLNAAGALTEKYKVGNIVLISDFIDLSGSHPLRGIQANNKLIEFINVSKPLDSFLEEKMIEAGRNVGVELKEGVYAMVRGPRYETRAECNYLKTIGAELVGMSTIPELVTAIAVGGRTAALSLVTNLAYCELTSHDEVLTASVNFSEKLNRLLNEFVKIYFEGK